MATQTSNAGGTCPLRAHASDDRDRFGRYLNNQNPSQHPQDQGPEHPQAYEHPQGPAQTLTPTEGQAPRKKKRGPLFIVLVVFGVLMACAMSTCAVLGIVHKDKLKYVSPLFRKTKIDDATAAALPWMRTVAEACKVYEPASYAEQKKIFEDNEEFLRTETVSDVRGVVKSHIQLASSELVYLEIGVDNVLFIAKVHGDSPLFATAAGMEEGQCVIFSANEIRIDPSFDKGGDLCDYEFDINLTSIAPCQ